ncbi:MAG TPA: CZB domain-containing protein [Candidatus Avoscillospira avistercoris]|uniref:CZB domain-containing protein n=1 Tax=Candidatus Avoscillospira avistercoris TaxID=2840707 RepID=A0A9D1JT94_9FIRM|nr:CZB domain-containing protein [Candidatus Avoscillospira avistercoris]
MEKTQSGISVKKSIRRRILDGYFKVLLPSVLLGVITIICLSVLFEFYGNTTSTDADRAEISNTISAHYQWRSDLINSLETGSAFTGSLNSKTCSFGQWLSDYQAKGESGQIGAAAQSITKTHDEIHSLAEELLNLRGTDPDLAVERFFSELDPKTADVIDGLYQIDSMYSAKIADNIHNFESLVTTIIVIIVVTIIAIIIFSYWYGRRLAQQIAAPVMMIADWSKDLSMGSVDLEIASDKLTQMEKENADNEVGLMISAFHVMADNIRENVSVVQRIADGDMTAFVKIRSRRDSLGRSLYRLVQSNDIMFNEIVDSAHSVAAGADEIATASHMLAESSTVQAAAAQSLSDEMKHVSELIHFNDEQAQSAYEITKAIEADLKTSDEHMKVLYDSVIQMRDASKKISSVMKAIDDITFETNILALNAAIEAARAGAAGKGFAVVADEVRALAMKSAEAAQESHRLIENSIKQTEHGSNLATESAAIFEGIHKKIAQIVEIVEKVSGLSTDQMQSIQQVANSVSQITEAATRNAAISEESDASSQEMRNQAAFLRDKMKHFNLRKREKGKAYIPDEKQYDSEFIEYANKAYHLKETTGHYGNEYIDPSGRDTETV